MNIFFYSTPRVATSEVFCKGCKDISYENAAFCIVEDSI